MNADWKALKIVWFCSTLTFNMTFTFVAGKKNRKISRCTRLSSDFGAVEILVKKKFQKNFGRKGKRQCSEENDKSETAGKMFWMDWVERSGLLGMKTFTDGTCSCRTSQLALVIIVMQTYGAVFSFGGGGAMDKTQKKVTGGQWMNRETEQLRTRHLLLFSACAWTLNQLSMTLSLRGVTPKAGHFSGNLSEKPFRKEKITSHWQFPSPWFPYFFLSKSTTYNLVFEFAHSRK